MVPPYTNHAQPTFFGTTSPNAQVELLLVINTSTTPPTYMEFSPPVFVTSDASGTFTVQFPLNGTSPFPDGTYTVEAKATYSPPFDKLGSTFSNLVTFVLKTHGPTTSPTLVLQASDDSGIVGDNITNVRRPHFIDASGGGDRPGLHRPGLPGCPGS